MFEEGKEILLFNPDCPEQLAEHIARIQREPGFAVGLAHHAQVKMRRFHTAEQRVANILDWINSGVEPAYV